MKIFHCAANSGLLSCLPMVYPACCPCCSSSLPAENYGGGLLPLGSNITADGYIPTAVAAAVVQSVRPISNPTTETPPTTPDATRPNEETVPTTPETARPNEEATPSAPIRPVSAFRLPEDGKEPATAGSAAQFWIRDSQAINANAVPKVILSASGMCDAGRIRHHLKHNLWHSENTVLFVGYQAEGTLGRALVDGAPSVKIFDEAIAVNAEIRVLAGVSGHADKNGLIRWLQGVSPKPAQIFVNHGDDEACTDFTQCLREEYGYNAMAPYSGTCYDLAAGAFLAQPAGVLRKKPEEAARDPRAMAAFSELQRAVKQLSALAQGAGGRPNKELKRMAAQVQALYDAWRA